MKYNYQKICQEFLEILPQRQKEVIARRFGLGPAQERETLQKIGNDFGVTRERVRQIEVEGFSRLQSQKDKIDLKRVFYYFQDYLQSQGGAKREDILLNNLGKNKSQSQVHFLLTLGKPFYRFGETEDVYPFWSQEKDIFEKVKKVVDNLFKKLEIAKKPLVKDSLLQISKNKYPELLLSSLEIAKKIEQGPLGEFGLTTWPEIKPRGVRDRAYLTLKKSGQPLHFKEIAQFSGQLPGEFFGKREVLPQTVHNELIRDQRFVLVGRGIYGLKEWGYIPGTVREIIKKILKDGQKPMIKEEILQEVQKQRLVKENTIFLNLSDRNYFLRDEKGRYTLKNF